MAKENMVVALIDSVFGGLLYELFYWSEFRR
ncbi:hypothetical protein LVISKB_1411 [Levilactobacillus brevis KB290]|uniref:Uncharacterized protein n=1 Tax=Levilactobacillus brevis KB290 TaxID=1001583 RepID=M5B0N0_LEVBR|nr:hypothetical protein LVISKB_1411 [Levilactobacillus brevis KB290]